MTHTSTYRMKGLATVAAYLAQMGTEIAERMTAWLREVLEPGETMPDVAFLFTLVGRKIGRALERLRELDGRLSRALAALDMARRARDRAAEKMRGVLIHGRDLLDGCTRESAAPARFRAASPSAGTPPGCKPRPYYAGTLALVAWAEPTPQGQACLRSKA